MFGNSTGLDIIIYFQHYKSFPFFFPRNIIVTSKLQKHVYSQRRYFQWTTPRRFDTRFNDLQAGIQVVFSHGQVESKSYRLPRYKRFDLLGVLACWVTCK